MPSASPIGSASSKPLWPPSFQSPSSSSSLVGEKQQDEDSSVLEVGRTEAKLILEEAFLKGTLFQRSIKLPSLAAGTQVTLYFRSPAAGDDDDVVWPYRRAPQCIWLQLEEPGGSRETLNIPGLALLAVLPQQPPLVLSTIQVPSPASKFICRGADVMRAGMLNTTNHHRQQLRRRPLWRSRSKAIPSHLPWESCIRICDDNGMPRPVQEEEEHHHPGRRQ